MASGEENSEALKCQTWVLKVSIHCEGCKRKVKKVLQSIDGVYTVNIDAQQHKVTVTGNVDADTLLKRLQKSGKNAELWPANKPNNNSSSSSGGGSGSGKDHKKSGSKPKEPSENLENKPPSANENTATAAGNPTTAKPSEAAKLSNEAAKNTGKEIKEEGGEHDTGRSSPPQEKLATTTPAATSEGGAIPATVTHGGSEGGKKKKKKKKSKEQNNPSGAAGGEADSEDKEAANTPAVGVGGHSPPRQPAYQVPVYHSQPVYAYSMTHPSVSYGNTYYAPAPPVSYSNVYGDHHQQDTYYVEEPASSSQSSYDLFSEENANACSIM